MVNYITQTGVEQNYGTGRAAKAFSLDSGTVFSTAVFATLRTRGQALVDGLLGTLYSVPFTSGSVPDQVTAIAEAVTFKMAVKRRRIQVPPEIQEECQTWIDFLDKVRTGEAVLVGATSNLHRNPFDPQRGAIPRFTEAKTDIDDNRVNTNIVKENDIGTLDAW